MKETKLKLEIPKGCHGHDLQELLYDFGSLYSSLNEQRDKAEAVVAKQKETIDDVEALAALQVDKEITDSDEKVTAPTRNARIRIAIVTWKENKTNVAKEKRELIRVKYISSRWISHLKTVDRLTGIGQSSLGYDKQELIKMGGMN